MHGSDPRKRSAMLYWVLGWALPMPAGAELRTYAERAFAAVQVFREAAEAEAWLSSNRAHTSGSTS